VNSRRRQPEITRAQLLGEARARFGDLGYAATNTEELVQGVGLTRGALYHHFANKKELFRVVVELVIDEMVEKVSSARPVDGDEWDFVIDGSLRYVDLCLEPGNVQIVVVDAPAVFGLRSVVERSERALGNQWEATLRACMAAGSIDHLPLAALGHVIATAVAESAIYVAASGDPAKARQDVGVVLVRMLEGLRRPA
jgi:AcrR family transcriptional regulator